MDTRVEIAPIVRGGHDRARSRVPSTWRITMTIGQISRNMACVTSRPRNVYPAWFYRIKGQARIEASWAAREEDLPRRPLVN